MPGPIDPAVEVPTAMSVTTHRHRAAGAAPVPPEALRVVPMFADLGAGELAWLAALGELVELDPGELLFHASDPALSMFVALDGVLQGRREELGANAPGFVLRAGDIGGAVPFSRMTTFTATGRAVTRASVARFPRSSFATMLERLPVLLERFVWHLLDRVRDATRRDAQFEKLMALGKLSAGIAHELNNPTSAVLQALAEAERRLGERGRLAAAVADAGLDGDAMRRLDALRLAATVPEVDALARSDRQEALCAWLTTAGVADAWSRAATFVDAGVDEAALDASLAATPPAARASALEWLEAGLATQSLVREAEVAARRMVSLVELMRAYTSRDRMREMTDVDVREGLETALALLAPRIAARRVAVTRRHADALPRIRAYPGDLNQAWSALLENALDAAPAGHGTIVVHTTVEHGAVVVEIRDDGPGIPPEIADRVWEPFFTTKDVGQGTGLGLDVARRVVVDLHGGSLELLSGPGDTRALARLPLSAAGTFGA